MYKKMIFGGAVCLLTGVAAFGAPAADKAVAPKAENEKKSESEQVVMSNLPDKIKLIIGIGETKNYYIRIRAIHSLGKHLPPDQVEALYKFLYTRLENQKLKDLQFNALKNEIVLELMHQKNPPKDLAGHLVKMYQDKTFDPTWRDYCVQFFGKWYADAPHNAGRKEMLENLYAAANEVEGSIGGTAVTMLRYIVTWGQPPKQKRKDIE